MKNVKIGWDKEDEFLIIVFRMSAILLLGYSSHDKLRDFADSNNAAKNDRWIKD